jgi:Polyketide synthase dehydratase
VLGRRLFRSLSESVYSSRRSIEKNWLLAEHRLKSGDALFPGTGYLQLAATALAGDQFEPGIMFEDVFFLAPLSVAPAETKEVRLRFASPALRVPILGPGACKGQGMDRACLRAGPEESQESSRGSESPRTAAALLFAHDSF